MKSTVLLMLKMLLLVSFSSATRHSSEGVGTEELAWLTSQVGTCYSKSVGLGRPQHSWDLEHSHQLAFRLLGGATLLR